VKQLRIDHVALTFCQFDDALEVFSSLLYNQIAWKQGSYDNFFFNALLPLSTTVRINFSYTWGYLFASTIVC
jgi:hypothetical protein